MPAIHTRMGDAVEAFWTQASIYYVLKATALRENMEEAARDKLMVQYWAHVATANDPSKSAPARLAAATKAEASSISYKSKLAEIAKHDPDALPANLATIRNVLIEHIEAATMKRMKEIKSAKSKRVRTRRPGVWTWPRRSRRSLRSAPSARKRSKKRRRSRPPSRRSTQL